MNLAKINSPEQLQSISDEKIFQYIDLHCRHLSGPKQMMAQSIDVILLCLVRNGESYLPAFLAHYQKLGIRYFLFLDNGSEDRTAEILAQAEEVTTYQCLLPYKIYFQVYKRYLVDRFAKEARIMIVDIDEFFDYPFSNIFPFSQLIAYLDKYQYDAVVTQMLDVFSQLPLGKSETREDFRALHRFYDNSQLVRVPYGIENEITHPEILFHIGGIRKKVFGLEKVFLTKHTLLRRHSKLKFSHEHWVEGARLADFSAVFIHYKFLDHFEAYVKDAVEKGYHASDSYEYKEYLKTLENREELLLYSATAQELKNINQLVAQQFLQLSDSYLEAVKSYVEDRGDPDLKELFISELISLAAHSRPAKGLQEDEIKASLGVLWPHRRLIAELESLKQSFSWRITAPIRRMEHLFQQLKSKRK